MHRYADSVNLGSKLDLRSRSFFLMSWSAPRHVISKRGVSGDPKKLPAISKMKSPKDKKGLMRVLGTRNFYREFIPRFSSLALPWTELLGNNVKFEWKIRQEIAFRALTDHLVRAPILIFLEYGKQFFLFSDASDDALGAVLYQDKKGILHPIGYQSKKLSKTEKRYPTIKKEALAVKWALEKFRQIIRRQDIIIFTDHWPLISIFGKNSPKGVIGRWVLAIQEYNARLRYLPGRENTTADMLSRVPTEKILEDSVEWHIGENGELEQSIFLMGNEREGKEKLVPDLEKIRGAQKDDSHCRKIMKRLLRGDEKRNSEGMEGFIAVEGIL